jgi:hypothetical protein
MAFPLSTLGIPIDKVGLTSSAASSLFLKLDQTTPQTVVNGSPLFAQGVSFPSVPLIDSNGGSAKAKASWVGCLTFTTAIGQSFAGNGTNLKKVSVPMAKTIASGTPPTITAKLYAHSGTFGTSGVPTGAVLATSTNTLDTSTLPNYSSVVSGVPTVDFLFSGYALVNGTRYVIVFDTGLGTIPAGQTIYFATSNNNSSGNSCAYSFSSWGASSADLIFYIYGDAAATNYETVVAPPISDNPVYFLPSTNANGLLRNTGGLWSWDATNYLTNTTGLTLAAPNQTVTQVPTLTNGIDSPKLTNLTTNGFVKTGSSNGTLSVDTTAYVSGAAGNSGNVQFNNGGAFGGDDGLFWDNTNKWLGIGTTTPTVPLDVVVGTTSVVNSGSDYPYTNVFTASNANIVPGSITGYTSGASAIVDDGAGNIYGSGSAIIATVDYVSGVFTDVDPYNYEVIINIFYNYTALVPASDAAKFGASVLITAGGISDSLSDTYFAIGVNSPAGSKVFRQGYFESGGGKATFKNFYGTSDGNSAMDVENFFVNGVRRAYGAVYTDPARGNHPTNVTLFQYYGDNGYQSLFSLQNLGIGDAIYGGYGTYGGFWARQDGVAYTSGNFSIGVTTTPSAALQVQKTTEQMRVGYDTSNYYKTTVGSTGIITLDAVGSGALFDFQDNVKAPKVLTPEIKTDTTTATDLTVNCGTDKTLILGETVWEDVQFTVSGAKVPAANAPTWEAFTTNTNEYSFAVNDYIDCGANEPPHGWKEGTSGSVHLHLAIKTLQNAGANRYAKFTVYVASQTVSAVWTETSVTAEYTIPNNTAALTHYLLAIGTVTFTNYLIGSQMKVRIKRIAATGGTEYGSNVFVTQAGIHVESDTLGSRQIATK